MHRFLIVLVCGMASNATAADDKPAADKPAPERAAAASQLETPLQKVSYALGNNVGGRMKSDKIEIDLDAFALGFKEALAGMKSRLSEEETTAVLTKLQEEMQRIQEGEAEAAGGENAKVGQEFLAANAKRKGVKTTASGLQYEVIKKGDGAQPKPEDSVKVHYHGTLVDGTVFDSSVERGEPIEFGVKQVIPGWTEALQLMNVGSKYKLVIPSKLAYGVRGAGDTIGPNSTLVFEVELLGVTPGPK